MSPSWDKWVGDLTIQLTDSKALHHRYRIFVIYPYFHLFLLKLWDAVTMGLKKRAELEHSNDRVFW